MEACSLEGKREIKQIQTEAKVQLLRTRELWECTQGGFFEEVTVEL